MMPLSRNGVDTLSTGLAGLCMLITCALHSHAVAQADELRYRWQPQQKFSYNVTITVDEDDKTTTFQGAIHYEVIAASAEQMKVVYRGGLNESARTKQSNRGGGGPFGPGGFGPFGRGGLGGPPSPFQRPTFAGKVQTTNRITMTPTGQVLAMEGDSHLPFLLGNVSLMPFESLPKDNSRQWVVDSGVSISEESDQSRRPFGPFGPFGPGAGSEKSVQAATEVTRYSLEGVDGNLVRIKKSYQLISPGGDGESFDFNGAGTWTFDQRDHVPHALDLSAKLIAKEGNSSTTFPITIKYQRISAAELARIEAEAKAKAEQQQKLAAEAKAKAEAPLTPDETQAALKSLANRNVVEIKKTLAELGDKSVSDPDPAIAAAIKPLLKHQDESIAKAAAKAMAKWSPEFKAKVELNKAYEGPGVLKSTDLEVNSLTQLYVGQIIQFNESGPFWRAGRIKSLRSDGKVVVESLAWGKPNGEVTLARRNLQLAPPEVDQPAAPAGSSQAAKTAAASVPPTTANQSVASMRSWTDKSGRFKIEASFVSESNGSVKLRRSDGREVSVPLDRLSPDDQTFVKQLADENPFEPK